MRDCRDPIKLQKQYYAQTARQYDQWHLKDDDGHAFALPFLAAMIDYLGVRSVLDLGSGTGRVLCYLKEHCPGLRILGIEPVAELRAIGHGKGLAEQELIDGDMTNIQFGAGEFDLVCAFGVLHHIKNSEAGVSEMIRVAQKAVFISDQNNFGHGSPRMRFIKQFLHFFGLWKAADFIKTKGKGYTVLKGDGLTYTYSVFNSYKQIRKHCTRVHLLNTKDAGINFYRTASHLALVGIKDPR